ncbi:MAG: flagellar protein FlaG [Hydrogenothermaceae bacterium]|nr:flagellar protein FlaG [Hydrogenothermaceae bacterium]
MSQKLTPQGITIPDKVEIQSKKSNVMDKDILKDTEELKKLIEELSSKLSYLNSQLKMKIEIDSEIGQPIVKIMDINTNEVIR